MVGSLATAVTRCWRISEASRASESGSPAGDGRAYPFLGRQLCMICATGVVAPSGGPARRLAGRRLSCTGRLLASASGAGQQINAAASASWA